MPYRVALIGTGRVGYQFSFSDLPDNHAEAVLQRPDCEWIAGVNRGREKLEAFGERFGVKALFHDYREMLETAKPDICIVATHPQLHAEMVEGCAEADSVRAIICEKPMALSLDECDRMIEACRRHDVLLQVNHNRRWNPEWNLARRLLHEGAIGELNHIYGYMDGVKPAPSWCSEYEGPLLHDATHYLDLMDYFAGEVDWICGVAEQRRRPWAVEDFGAAFLKFKSGATGLLHAAELSTYTEHGFELRGSEGVMRLQKEKLRLFTATPAMRELDSGFEWSALEEREVEHPEPASSYVLSLAELIKALEGKGTLRSDGEAGRRSLEMVMAIYRSQLEGNRPVSLPLAMGESGVDLLRGAGHFAERDGEETK